ncbi:MAG: SDR family NAD(P)-dependent oxidoreductase, partial [Planctomycetes bacterium]|nr:SDR family NAD(P)-dependent oxidoreductase [Planctomycetota bacterium]
MSIKQHKQPPAALVTGAAVRIGKAIALDLAEMGYSIALHCHRSRAEAKKLCRNIETLGAACEIFQADLTNPDELEHLIPAVK